jgi:hypothetical protein
VSGTDDRLVALRGGFVVPVEPYLLLLDLERRGIPIALDGGDLLVGPSRDLTDDDRAALRVWKPHLVELVRYCAGPATSLSMGTDLAS